MLFSLIGLILAAACISVTMTVMSSYETTLKQTLINRTGHLIITSRNKKTSEKFLLKKISPHLPSLKASTPFLQAPALALSNGELSGILLEGIDKKTFPSVIPLQEHIIKGRLFKKENEIIIGKELARKLKLKTGSTLSIALPEEEGQGFPLIKNFFVSGILDLGHFDFNARLAAAPLASVQKLTQAPGQITGQITGLRLRMTKDSLSREEMNQLKQKLSPRFQAADWKSVNQNLFRAIEMEKTIIFFILLILVVAASFNISNHLFIDVLRRFRDIGILKAMGAGPWIITQLFLIQSLIITTLGAGAGLLLGALISTILFGFYNTWGALAPSDVYKLGQIILDFRLMDFVIIFCFSIFICFMGALIPIRKALSLPPREGLSYE